MSLDYINFKNLLTLFIFMFINLNAWVLYGILITSFTLIPKIKQLYLSKNFVLIFCISGFVYGVIVFCISYFLPFIIKIDDFILTATILYVFANFFMNIIASIVFILICFLMIKNKTDIKPLNNNQIKIVCIMSLIHCILSPFLCFMFIFL
ncbi:hypothetical protein B6S12_08405 [Helicobacter valdiviensis]|uniref:Uncharacterized protein n=1 Tax=Helicobacter valdiviensis TaxID=1458358 RepID=A0A2W6MSX5_9HELI|nr:hypothetical protein B6S12_08405 [Helicobacter valdiviensis]